jgi:hypothetical protein
MSTTSHSPTSSRPGDEPSNPLRSRNPKDASGLITLAVVVLLIGLPVALVLTTIVTLKVLAWSPSYQTTLSIATSVAVLVMTGLTLWMGVRVHRSRPVAGGLIVVASVFAAATALLLTLGGLRTTEGGVPPPTVINASSQTVVVLAGPEDNLNRWTTLSPGEHADADIPFFATDGCYRDMWLEARTTDGRVIGTLFNPCTGDTWRITDTGAERR